MQTIRIEPTGSEKIEKSNWNRNQIMYRPFRNVCIRKYNEYIHFVGVLMEMHVYYTRFCTRVLWRIPPPRYRFTWTNWSTKYFVRINLITLLVYIYLHTYIYRGDASILHRSEGETYSGYMKNNLNKRRMTSFKLNTGVASHT